MNAPLNHKQNIDQKLSEAMQRLAQFEEWTGTKCQSSITEGRGKARTFAHDFLVYANANNLNLDWLWLFDMRGLVMAYHRQAVPTETPIMALFKEWKVAKADEDRIYNEEPTGNGDTPECAAATNAVKAMESRLIALPCETVSDFAMKVVGLTGNGQWSLPGIDAAPEFWAEARALIGGDV